MRIHDRTGAIDPTAARAFAKATAADKPEASRDAARVSVSSGARALANAGARDAARVEALRGAIRDGTFRVDAHAIAAKLVGDPDEDGDGS